MYQLLHSLWDYPTQPSSLSKNKVKNARSCWRWLRSSDRNSINCLRNCWPLPEGIPHTRFRNCESVATAWFCVRLRLPWWQPKEPDSFRDILQGVGVVKRCFFLCGAVHNRLQRLIYVNWQALVRMRVDGRGQALTVDGLESRVPSLPRVTWM